jgi:hypothetical protein
MKLPRSHFASGRGRHPVGCSVHRTGQRLMPSDYTFCCGNDRYKMMCDSGSVRCYENQGGKWSYTYGSKCDQNIHDCYTSVNANSPCCQ